MKHIFLILIILFCANDMQSQNHRKLQENWVKIIIYDAYGNGDWGFSNKYEIQRKDLLIVKKSKNEQDSIIKKVKLETINNLFNEFNNNNLLPNDPLSKFGKDSTWLINNAEELWNNYDIHTTNEINIAAIKVLKHYTEIKEAIDWMEYESWTNDYPYIEVNIIGIEDTLKIVSEWQYPFMLPWIYEEDTMFYNFKISEIIASFLPDIVTSNKKRLSGQDFNKVLIDEIYHYKIEKKVDLIRAENRHPIQFKRLKKHYQVLEAEISYLSSLSWGNGTRCLDLKLQDTTIVKNIYFSAILGKRLFLHPIIPILKFRKRVIKKLEDNPVYQYTLKNENSNGTITFINRKSLSNKAKKAFLEDAKERNFSFNNLENRLNNAIMYDLREERNNGRSYSMWLFLEDGTLILWNFKGDFLMNLPKEILREEGYICKVISRDLVR